MTHTLHRRGSKSDLAHDYVVLAMAARGVKRDGAAPKLAQALEIFAAHNPVNYGNVAGNSFTRTLPEMVSLTRDNTVSHAVFRDIEDVTAVLQDLKKEDHGQCVAWDLWQNRQAAKRRRSRNCLHVRTQHGLIRCHQKTRTGYRGRFYDTGTGG